MKPTVPVEPGARLKRTVAMMRQACVPSLFMRTVRKIEYRLGPMSKAWLSCHHAQFVTGAVGDEVSCISCMWREAERWVDRLNSAGYNPKANPTDGIPSR